MRRRLLLALSALAMTLGSPAFADCQPQILELPVRLVGGRPVTTLKLNGTDVPMLVDSGAFFSMLSATTARQLKLQTFDLPSSYRVRGFAGEIEGLQRTRIEKAGFGGKDWTDVEFMVGGNESEHYQGMLGRSILAMGDTEYDLARGMVKLVFPQSDCRNANLAYWAGKDKVFTTPLIGDDPRAPRVAVRINGKEVTAMMDTGATHSILQLRAARRAGVKEADMASMGRVGGAGAGRAQVWMVPVDAFEFGEQKLSNNRMAVTDAETEDFILGLDYLLSHRVYVSRLQRKVYATYNGGPVFSSEGHAAADASDKAGSEVPQDADVLMRRGAAAAARNDLQGALTDLDRACALAPHVALYRLARARVYLEMKRRDAAAADLDEVLKLDPALHEARIERATLYAQRGDVPQALVDLQALDAALPPSAHLRQRMAELYGRHGSATEALRQWQLWLDSHPNDVGVDDVLNSRCWMRTTRNFELALALDDCRKAVATDRKNTAYLDSLGWTYLRLGQPADAVKAFDAALALNARLPGALYGRALAQLRLGRAEAAKRDLGEARRLQPAVDALVRKFGLPTVESAAPEPAAGAAG
ncbi:clan AA aspartic protease (TIGR02281 family) [Pelomonas saccharophila]|uniref:Clan AA aspartic protease (TIGR02281 family) n=1 Tax=Roseateles saccharophilus TaxID=304 RepID=A0ABU1YKD5_ROSSA|nr:retroviral-like aspartic protease family protein [Roseateles saccharophilus]MDR7269326.1 clan AA aspartic protease (TIGR02281 family) [Roseateles saccharophilus]